MTGILIKNGQLLVEGKLTSGDVAVHRGLIMAAGALNPGDFPGYVSIDADRRFILPGGIDPHVHLALPTPAGNSCDDFIRGSMAAISGGTTTLFDFVTPQRGQSLIEALQARRREASESQAHCFLHLGISEWNPAVRHDLIQCIENSGIISVKCYLAYRESIGIDYKELREVMKTLAGRGVVLMVHCEDGKLIRRNQQELINSGKVRPAFHSVSRPAEAEISAISEVAEMSSVTGCCSYIVHISTRKGAEVVKAAKDSGISIFGETCPQYLLLDNSVYHPDLPDRKVLPYIISPPIRSLHDQEGLWDAVADGSIDVVATDHCPFNLEGQKERGILDFTRIPNGAGGIEHRLSLLFTYGVLPGKIGIQRFVELVSSNPARIFGLDKSKGRLQPGYDADIIIWNPEAAQKISAANHRSFCDTDIYEGFYLQGKAEKVFIQGTEQTNIY